MLLEGGRLHTELASLREGSYDSGSTMRAADVLKLPAARGFTLRVWPGDMRLSDFNSTPATLILETPAVSQNAVMPGSALWMGLRWDLSD